MLQENKLNSFNELSTPYITVNTKTWLLCYLIQVGWSFEDCFAQKVEKDSINETLAFVDQIPQFFDY